MSYEVKLPDEIMWGSLSVYMLGILRKIQTSGSFPQEYKEYVTVAIQFIDSILEFKKKIDRLDFPELALSTDKWSAYNCAKAIRKRMNRDDLSLDDFLGALKTPLEEILEGNQLRQPEIRYLEDFFDTLDDYCSSKLGMLIEGVGAS